MEYVILSSTTSIIIPLTVGTARYIMITLDVARACNKSDISPVMIAPIIENKRANRMVIFPFHGQLLP